MVCLEIFGTDCSKEQEQKIKTEIDNVVKNMVINETTINTVNDIYNEISAEMIFEDTSNCEQAVFNSNMINLKGATFKYCSANIYQRIKSKTQNLCKQVSKINTKKINKISDKFSQKVEDTLKQVSDTQIKNLVDNTQKNAKLEDAFSKLIDTIGKIIPDFGSKKKLSQEQVTKIKNSVSNTIKNKLTKNLTNKVKTKISNKTTIKNFKSCLQKQINKNYSDMEGVTFICRDDDEINISQGILSNTVNKCLQTSEMVKSTFNDLMTEVTDETYKKTVSDNKTKTDTTSKSEQEDKKTSTLTGIDYTKLFTNISPVVSISSLLFLFIIVILLIIFTTRK